MKPISASGSFILFLITALSVKAGSLANDALPHREASLPSVDVLRQNEELNLCETFPERKPKDQFGCYRVGATNKTIPKCWRKCKYDWKNGCGQHRWCHIDNSKCTLSQYKKAACVKKWWLDDRGACPKRWNKYYCDERVGVSYACGDGIWRCWRSCDKGELGCKSSGYCYADNGAGYRKDCSLDKSCKIVTEYPCL